MPILKVHGHHDPTLRAGAPGGRFLRSQVRDAVVIESVRSGGTPIEIDVEEDDVIELALEDDITWVVTFDSLRNDLRWNVTRGDAAVDGGRVIELGSTVRVGEPSRGIGGLALKAVKVLGLDLPRESARFIAGRLEDQLEPGPGLYRCADPRRLERLVDPADLSDGQTALLLIHGTASSTAGSFGGLVSGGDGALRMWESIRRRYDGRVFAYDHHTLTRSPLENAIDLVERLPDRAVLHLVTHSRGGIVGEVLARGHRGGPAFTEIDFGVFERSVRDGVDRTSDLEAMRRLNELFSAKELQVERFVRVACPAAGTTLASGRLDLYFNVLFNIIKRIPLVRQTMVFDFVADLLKALAKERTDPSALPGLEAQMPESPLIRVLNNPGHRVDSELNIIAGDVEQSGFVRRLLVLAADLFYRADHDLVVNTESMYGGTPRVARPRYLLDTGKSVDHFHYFINSRTRAAIADALAGRAGNGTAFQPLPSRSDVAARTPALLRESPPRTATPRPVVFVLPGIMGSELSVRGDQVWVHLLRLATGGLAKLEIDDQAVEPAGLVGSAYADILTFLARSFRVVPFAYDWRKSIRNAADVLAERVREELDASDQPVRFLAHSMGGLVGRAMIARHPDVWEAMRQRDGCRFVMLGTPNGGSYMIPETLVGRSDTLRKLALVDLKNDRERILEIVARYPGLLELLPVHDDDHKYFEPKVWEDLQSVYETGHWPLPDSNHLRAARTFYDEVLAQSPIDPDVMCYVAGRAAFTPMGHDIVTDDSGRRAAFFATREGDGRVPWSTGIPEELVSAQRVWYMDVEHGKMAAHLPGFIPIRDLLEKGTTARFPQRPPVERGTAIGRFEMPEMFPSRYPDAEDLEAAVVGFEPAPTTEGEAVGGVEVSVTHGELAYAQHPVMVGHFRGDGIVSAERILDHHLDGRMSALHVVGLYPGEVGTAEVILNEGGYPPGAIVVGLGTPGELTAGKLAAGYEHAAMLFAQRWHEHVRRQDDSARGSNGWSESAEPPRLSTVLVGSAYGGLNVRTAIRSILGAVQSANRRLEEAAQRLQTDHIGGDVRKRPRPIAAVEIIELYEDRAVQALHALTELLEEGGLEGITMASGELRPARGGRHAALNQRMTDDWDTRVQVCERPDAGNGILPGLQFTALTERARAEVTSLPMQRHLLDKLIRQAVVRPDWEPELAQTLFELLLPNEFKTYAADRRNIIWVLDDAAAAYPWELLHDPQTGDREPLAVRAGMLRQLAAANYRRQVDPALTRRALVVGEPDLGSDAPFAPLQGAYDEAKAVAEQLESAGYEVVRLLRARDDEIIRKLLADDYQVLHLAGHGVFEHEVGGERVTGMVLGPETFLTPAIIQQMRRVPEIVFVNCCHLGRADAAAEHEAADRNRLAANLGTQLIAMGVRAVVAAGWAVQDDAASAFARLFYEQMLEGENFREAVRCARADSYRRHGETTTWGAYQCYGHPYFSIREQASRQEASPSRFVAPVEAVTALKNFVRTVEAAAERDRGDLRSQLRAIVDGLRQFPAWQERSDVLEALAGAHQALDLLPEALRYYEALTRPDAESCSTGALEELAALQVRWGVLRAVDPDASPAERQAAAKRVDAGIRRLERLFDLDPTHDRMLRLGGAYKRLARMQRARGEDPVPALSTAIDRYREAFDGIRKHRQAIDHYPLLVWLTLDALKGWLGRHDPLPEDELKRRVKWIEEARVAAAASDAAAPSFWSLSVEADYLMLVLLDPNLPMDPTVDGRHDRAVQWKIETYGDRLADAVRTAWRRGGSYDVRRTILDDLDFLRTMLALPEGEEADTTKRGARRALASHLRTFRDDLAALMTL